jgi:hypothetical protein
MRTAHRRTHRRLWLLLALLLPAIFAGAVCQRIEARRRALREAPPR